MLCGGNQKQQFVLCPFSSLTNQRAIKRFRPGVRSSSGFVQSLAWQIFSTSNLYFSVEKGNHANRAGFSPALVLCQPSHPRQLPRTNSDTPSHLLRPHLTQSRFLPIALYSRSHTREPPPIHAISYPSKRGVFHCLILQITDFQTGKY